MLLGSTLSAVLARQEAQLHASDMLNVVPENTSLVGGRAESAAEFLQQMKERDNAGMGPKLSWG